MIKEKTLKLVNIAMMSVIIVVCSWITIPFVVPFTLQTFGVFLALKVLGGKNGTCAIAIYILLGIVGLPVFSGFHSGLGHIMGPTGGYIVGFLFSGITYWGLSKLKSFRKYTFATMFICMLLCYVIGLLWFANVCHNKSGNQLGIFQIISLTVLPFVIPDAVKIFLANSIGKRLKILIGKINK